MDRRLSVILPTYNEHENLPILVEDLIHEFEGMGVDHEIVIVDDNSPDGTWRVAQRLAAERGSVRTIVRKYERGLASAIRTGIENSSHPILCIMDTDLSHPPRDVCRMLQMVDGYDMVWASRYITGGRMKALGKKWIQKWFSHLFNLYLKLVLGIRILDSTNGFFLTKRSVLDLVDTREVFSGYGDFAFRLLYRLKGKSIRLLEIPFTYEERRSGESKTNLFSISMKYFSESLKLIMVPERPQKKYTARQYGQFAVGGGLGLLTSIGITAFLAELIGLWHMHAYMVGVTANVLSELLCHRIIALNVYGRAYWRPAIATILALVIICLNWALVYAATMVYGFHYIPSIMVVCLLISVIVHSGNRAVMSSA